MIANLFCKKKTPIVYKNAAYLVAVRFIKLYLLVGFLLRLVLMFCTPTEVHFTTLDVIRSLGVGFRSRHLTNHSPLHFISWTERMEI